MKANLNEKIWFGKHKGSRIRDIISNDPKYIKKILKEGSLFLNKEAEIYLKYKLTSFSDHSTYFTNSNE
jgi:hypothetical protein